MNATDVGSHSCVFSCLLSFVFSLFYCLLYFPSSIVYCLLLISIVYSTFPYYYIFYMRELPNNIDQSAVSLLFLS